MVQKRRSVLAMVRALLPFPPAGGASALRSCSLTAISEAPSFVRAQRAFGGCSLPLSSCIARLGRAAFPTHSTHEYAGFRNDGVFEPGFRSEVMTGCLLVGASYALLNTQTHAVGAVAAVGVEDSKVLAIDAVVL